jgi:DeoR family suf operon transcriptional repressor
MMSSTRENVLKTLLTRPRITINDLADQVGINPISVRHHISSLQADGLVTSDEERHGVGRPRRVYYLTEAGVEKFPTRYIRLTVRLLEQLKEKMPAAMVDELFSQMAHELLEDQIPFNELKLLNLEERLEFIADLLKREGFTIEWERVGNEYLIHESSCPYYHIGQDHPEVCSVDRILISSVLSTPASKTNCILNGDNVCTYVVPVNPNAEISSKL